MASKLDIRKKILPCYLKAKKREGLTAVDATIILRLKFQNVSGEHAPERDLST